MQKKTKDINKMQLLFLMTTLGMVFKIIYLPVLLVEISGHDSWITVLLMWAIDLSIAGIIFAVYLMHPDKTMSEIIQKTLGKAARVIILLIFTAFLIFKTYFIFSTALKFMITNLYENLTWNPFVLPLLVFLMFGTYKGLRAISRTNEMFGIVVLGVITISVIIFLLNADYSSILPICEFGFNKPLTGLNQYILGTGDFIVCFLFLGRIKEESGTARCYWLGIIIALVLTLAFSLAYYTFYNNISAFQHHGHILSDMAKSFRDSDTLARLDTVVIIFWIVVCLLHLLIHAWSTKQGLMDAFDKEDIPKNRLLFSLPLVAPLAILSAFFLISTPVTPEIFASNYRWIGCGVLFSLPVFILILSFILKYKENVDEQRNQTQSIVKI